MTDVTPHAEDSERRLFTLQETAALLGISVQQLTRLTYDGEIAFVSVGRTTKRLQRRFDQADIDGFIQRRRRLSPLVERPPEPNWFETRKKRNRKRSPLQEVTRRSKATPREKVQRRPSTSLQKVLNNLKKLRFHIMEDGGPEVAADYPWPQRPDLPRRGQKKTLTAETQKSV